jgi:hypothetical protein
VSFDEIYRLMRRHLVAVMVVFVVAAGMAWDIKKTPVVYSESGNVIFVPPAVNPYSSIAESNDSLIATAYVMMQEMLSPASEQKIREAGGTADFNLALVNLSNEQYPYYGRPYVTLTTTSVNPADVHRTFTIVGRSFQHLVSDRQVQAGAPPTSFISTPILGDTGPIAQVSSLKRAYAGLAILAIVTAFLVAGFLDRHPIWPSVRRHLARYVPSSWRGPYSYNPHRFKRSGGTDRIATSSPSEGRLVQPGLRRHRETRSL